MMLFTEDENYNEIMEERKMMTDYHNQVKHFINKMRKPVIYNIYDVPENGGNDARL